MAQQLDDFLTLDLVVFDDKKALLMRRDVAFDAIERVLEILPRRRLDEAGKRAMQQPVQPPFFNREHLHRDVTHRRILLEIVEDGPAQHIGQEDVQRDGGRPILSCHRQRHLPTVGDDAFESLGAHQFEEEARVMRVILDDEQHLVAFVNVLAIVPHRTFPHRTFKLDRRRLVNWRGQRRRCRRRWRLDRWRGGDTCRPGVCGRQVQREGAALARNARQLDFATEQRGQLTADRQAEAGAAVFAARPGIGLLERLEDQPLFLGCDADAGVDHLDREGLRHRPQDRMAGRPPCLDHGHAHRHLASRRELERVRQQVLENLLQPFRIARDRPRQ